MPTNTKLSLLIPQSPASTSASSLRNGDTACCSHRARLCCNTVVSVGVVEASPKVGFKPMHFRPTPLQRLHKASSADWEEGVAIRLTSISPMMMESSHLSPSSATALRSSRRISRVCLPAPTKLILEGLTKMPGFLGLDLGDCDAVQAEVNQVTSVCSSYLKGFIALRGGRKLYGRRSSPCCRSGSENAMRKIRCRI
jgi:hypothetical protein